MNDRPIAALTTTSVAYTFRTISAAIICLGYCEGVAVRLYIQNGDKNKDTNLIVHLVGTRPQAPLQIWSTWTNMVVSLSSLCHTYTGHPPSSTNVLSTPFHFTTNGFHSCSPRTSGPWRSLEGHGLTTTLIIATHNCTRRDRLGVKFTPDMQRMYCVWSQKDCRSAMPVPPWGKLHERDGKINRFGGGAIRACAARIQTRLDIGRPSRLWLGRLGIKLL